MGSWCWTKDKEKIPGQSESDVSSNPIVTPGSPTSEDPPKYSATEEMSNTSLVASTTSISDDEIKKMQAEIQELQAKLRYINHCLDDLKSLVIAALDSCITVSSQKP